MSLITSLQQRLAGIFNSAPSVDAPAPGVYHYRKETPDGKARLHLRLEPDGRGLLLVNASRAYQLNPSAARMAYLSLEGIPTADAIQLLRKWYNAPIKQVTDDYAQLCEQIETLTDPGEHCPICELDLEIDHAVQLETVCAIPHGPGPDLPLQ